MKKTVFITGASRGIGAECALYFAKNGYDVAVNYLNSKEKALNIVSQIKALGQNAIAIQGDVSDKNQVKNMILECEKNLGTISVLVNNAGIAQQKVFGDITSDDWKEMFSVNVDGVYNTIHEILPQMLHEKRGAIINISSMWGVVGASCEVHYSAAKSAVIGLTKALAQELAPSNIRVNCVAPGLIDTDMNKCFSDEEMEMLIQEIPSDRVGRPQEVSELVKLLVSGNEYLTGQVINLDGGWI